MKDTKHRIKDAFISISQSKSLEEITVKYLCENAKINRGTFYKHYKDIYDLYGDIEQEYYLALTSDIDFYKYDLHEIILKLLNTIKNYAELNPIIIQNMPNSSVPFRCILYYKDFILEKWKSKNQDLTDLQLEYLFASFIGGASQMINVWIQRKFKETEDEIYELLLKSSLILGSP